MWNLVYAIFLWYNSCYSFLLKLLSMKYYTWILRWRVQTGQTYVITEIVKQQPNSHTLPAVFPRKYLWFFLFSLFVSVLVKSSGRSIHSIILKLRAGFLSVMLVKMGLGTVFWYAQVLCIPSIALTLSSVGYKLFWDLWITYIHQIPLISPRQKRYILKLMCLF